MTEVLPHRLRKSPTRAPGRGAEMDAAFADFLRIDVANGDASAETIGSYRTGVAQWVAWCASEQLRPGDRNTAPHQTFPPVAARGWIQTRHDSLAADHREALLRGRAECRPAAR